jgi:hypothetical protein
VAPIQELESIDLVGRRRDGGVDLIIVASQPLDDATKTLGSIRQKVAYYLEVMDHPDFQAERKYPPRSQTKIILTCDHPIHPSAAGSRYGVPGPGW